MYYEELAERARYFKKDSQGVAAMSEIWEEVLQEGRVEGRAEGETKLGRLINILLQNGKTQDAQAAATDEIRRKQLYLEYNIN